MGASGAKMLCEVCQAIRTIFRVWGSIWGTQVPRMLDLPSTHARNDVLWRHLFQKRTEEPKMTTLHQNQRQPFPSKTYPKLLLIQKLSINHWTIPTAHTPHSSFTDPDYTVSIAAQHEMDWDTRKRIFCRM